MFHVPNNFRLKLHPILGSEDIIGNNGFFVFNWQGYIINVQASDGMGWEHCSVTINRQRTPSWEVMCKVKDLFWDKEDVVIQYHPPESEYVNMHNYCLHLWRSTEFEFPIPNPILVGLRSVDN